MPDWMLNLLQIAPAYRTGRPLGLWEITISFENPELNSGLIWSMPFALYQRIEEDSNLALKALTVIAPNSIWG